jgi:hypothetical protein
MSFEPSRINEMISICETIVEVESFYDNTANVKVEFLNGKLVNQSMKTKDEVSDVFDKTTMYGSTNIGRQLREKILKERLYKRPYDQKIRPLLVSIITDGKVTPLI